MAKRFNYNIRKSPASSYANWTIAKGTMHSPWFDISLVVLKRAVITLMNCPMRF
jgi:hypothetical protein